MLTDRDGCQLFLSLTHGSCLLKPFFGYRTLWRWTLWRWTLWRWTLWRWTLWRWTLWRWTLWRWTLWRWTLWRQSPSLLSTHVTWLLSSETFPHHQHMAPVFLRGGGGEGGHQDLFLKLDSEIAVDQQTRTHDRTFEGVSELRVPTGSWGTATPIIAQFLAQFCQITLTCAKPCFGCSTCSY